MLRGNTVGDGSWRCAKGREKLCVGGISDINGGTVLISVSRVTTSLCPAANGVNRRS